MRKIAVIAVLFALLTAAASAHLVGADAAQHTPKPATSHHTNAQAHRPAAKAAKASAKPAKAATASAPAPVMVTVQAGDTLSGIAHDHDTTYVRLFDANEAVTDPNVIDVGQQLRVPTADEQLPDRLVAVVAAPAAAPTATLVSQSVAAVPQRSYPAVSGNDAKAFIYSHESGNNPNSTSPRGCYGLGQDCNGRVQAQCGADYACQDAYFTSYATSRYGSWEAAAAYWQQHGWW